MKIPVFTTTSTVPHRRRGGDLNGLQMQGKKPEGRQGGDVRRRRGGAGLPGPPVMLGIPVENIWVSDIEGVVFEGAPS